MYRDDDDYYLTSGTDGDDKKPNKLFSPQPEDFDDDEENESTVVMSKPQVSKLQQIARDTGQGAQRPQQAVKKTMIGMPVVFPKKGGPQEQRPSAQRPQRVVRPAADGPSPSVVVSPESTVPSMPVPTPAVPPAQKKPITPIVGKQHDPPIPSANVGMPQVKAKAPQPVLATPTISPGVGFDEPQAGERTLVMDAPPDFDALLRQVAATTEAAQHSHDSAPEPTAAMPALTDEMMAQLAASAQQPKPVQPAPTPVLTPALQQPQAVQPPVPQLKPLAPTPSPSPQPVPSSLHTDATLRPSDAPTMQPMQLPPQLANLAPPAGSQPTQPQPSPMSPSPMPQQGGFAAPAGNAAHVFNQGPQIGGPQAPSGALPYAPQPVAPRAPQAPVARPGKAVSAGKSEATKSGYLRLMALVALLAAAVAWIGPMMLHPDKPKSDKVAAKVLENSWPVPLYGEPFANLGNWGEGQLPLVIFAGVMLLAMILPMPYLLRALLVGGAGTAMFLLAVKLQGNKPMLTQITEAKDAGFYVMLSTLILPIGLFMRGHYKGSTLARILVVLGMLSVLFVYFGVHFISDGFKDRFVILTLIEGVMKGDTLAAKLHGGLLILPLLFAVLGVLAFMDKSWSGLCGLWGFLFLASFTGAFVCFSLFSTPSEAKTAAVGPVAHQAWFFAATLAMTIGLGHFFGEIGKKVGSPD